MDLEWARTSLLFLAHTGCPGRRLAGLTRAGLDVQRRRTLGKGESHESELVFFWELTAEALRD